MADVEDGLDAAAGLGHADLCAPGFSLHPRKCVNRLPICLREPNCVATRRTTSLSGKHSTFTDNGNWKTSEGGLPTSSRGPSYHLVILSALKLIARINFFAVVRTKQTNDHTPLRWNSSACASTQVTSLSPRGTRGAAPWGAHGRRPSAPHAGTPGKRRACGTRPTPRRADSQRSRFPDRQVAARTALRTRASDPADPRERPDFRKSDGRSISGTKRLSLTADSNRTNRVSGRRCLARFHRTSRLRVSALFTEYGTPETLPIGQGAKPLILKPRLRVVRELLAQLGHKAFDYASRRVPAESGRGVIPGAERWRIKRCAVTRSGFEWSPS
jgi:hypothetical protein